MSRLARISTGRPKLVLAVSGIVAIALALIGIGVVHSLSPTITTVPGTESAHAQHLAKARFGPSQLVPILLEGPKSQLDQQGPALVRQLLKRPHTRALTAWDSGSASAGLRPKPTQALIVVSVDKSLKTVVKTDQPQIERTVNRVIHTPVKSYVSGEAGLDRAIKNAALSTTLRSGLIAVGILFVLLLIGLRAPLAAAALTAVGAAIVLDAYGIMALLGKVIAIDPVGVTGATVRGLALGVGLSLMFLDRFREEKLPEGSAPRASAVAATRALNTTGRAVGLAAGLLIMVLILAALVGPNVILTSIGAGVVAAAFLALYWAVVVMPAMLTVWGGPIVGKTFPAPAFLQRGWDRLVNAGGFVTRHAVIVGAVATAFLAALVIPAFGLKTGPLDPKQLPPDSQARIAAAKIQQAMGPGYLSPYSIIVASDKGPITSSKMLLQLQTFEQQIAKDPRVASVVGPGAVRAQTKDLGKLPVQLKSSAKLLKNGPKDLSKLENGLGQAGAGSAQLQSGLGAAASGAGQLQSGGGQAQAGAGKLHAGLVTAHDGSAQISGGLAQALDGAKALQAGAAKALSGSTQLTNGLSQAQGPVVSGLPALKGIADTATAAGQQAGALHGTAQGAAGDTGAALGALESMTTGKNDPAYSDAVAALTRARDATAAVSSGLGDLAPKVQGTASGVGAVASQTTALAAGLTQLHNGAGQLQAGIAQLKNGNADLAGGIGQLSGGGTQLTGGIAQLRDGAGALEAGLGDLTNGAGQLQSGIAGGIGPTGQLVTGLGVMQAGVAKFAGQLPSPKDLEKLQQQSPGLFDSGYFVLAAVQGAPPASRNEASFAVNLTRGGNAGQIVVVPKYAASDPRTQALATHLRKLSDTFASRAGAQVAVGGLGGQLGDFKSEINSRLWLGVAVLSIAVTLVLMIALRAVLLPIVAVAFNLLALGATFGLMKLLFTGDNPPFGGPGWVDSLARIETITAVFGLSLVFLVLLLTRIREEYLARGDLDRGLTEGMRHTAAAATGVGFVMLAAIIPFAASQLINVRQLMTGVAIVVLLDVLVVRPVLMPAAIKVLGRWAWWPTWAPGERPRLPLHVRRPHLPHARPTH